MKSKLFLQIHQQIINLVYKVLSKIEYVSIYNLSLLNHALKEQQFVHVDFLKNQQLDHSK